MISPAYFIIYFFFFDDTATTAIYTLSLHDALPISSILKLVELKKPAQVSDEMLVLADMAASTSISSRSEEHTSELQSHHDLVCRLLLEKKKNETTVRTAHEYSDIHHCQVASRHRNT